MKSVVIAYEPVWAIGTGLTATPEAAQVCICMCKCMCVPIGTSLTANPEAAQVCMCMFFAGGGGGKQWQNPQSVPASLPSRMHPGGYMYV